MKVNSLNSLFRNNFSALLYLFKQANVHPLGFLLPVILALIAAALEGIGFSLLIPTIKSIIESETSFIKELFFLDKVIAFFLQITLLEGKKAVFGFLVGLIFIVILSKNVIQYISSCLMAFRLRYFSNKLRKLIYERYLSFGKLFFDENNIGRLQQILTGYTSELSQVLKDLFNVLSSIFLLFIYFVIMLFISWKLTIFVVIAFPIVNFLCEIVMEKMKRTSMAYINSVSNLVRYVTNSLTCIPLVKTYAYEEEEKKRFDKVSDQIQLCEYSMDKKYLVIQPAQEIMLIFLLLILVIAIAFLVIKDKSGDVASFMIFFVILKRSFGSIGTIGRFNASIAAILGPIKEITSVFSNDGKWFVQSGNKEFYGLNNSIKLNNLRFSYPNDVSVLKGINLSITKGSLTALVGPSGAGKSTIINLIMRLYECKLGSIFFDDIDVRDFILQSLYAKLALVSQDTQLLNASIKENLVYGLRRDVSDREIQDIVLKARLNDLVSKLPQGLDTEIGDKGIKLSGGEKQRLSIARAILKNAEIIILDEATSALDSGTEKLIQEAIDEAIEERTTIVIAHRLSTIKHADKIVVIEDGLVVEEGTLNELLDKKGRFYQLWEDQKFY